MRPVLARSVNPSRWRSHFQIDHGRQRLRPPVQEGFDTNVFGVVRMIRAVAPEMRERKAGVIINLSSSLGWLTLPYTAAYAASKHAVESLSEGLWYELAPFSVRVAVVEPGVFPTNFTGNAVMAPGFDTGSPHWDNAQRYGAALRPTMQASRGSDDDGSADLPLRGRGRRARLDPCLQAAGV